MAGQAEAEWARLKRETVAMEESEEDRPAPEMAGQAEAEEALTEHQIVELVGYR